MKRILAVVAAAAGLLVGVGHAAAATSPEDPAAQAAGQTATSGQAAGALSGASQSQPANQNISVRVLSPGDNGKVKQSNTVDSNSTAANANLTGQSADQTQDSSCGCPGGIQAVGQEADSNQAATALSFAWQGGASNRNIPVRVLSDGDNGDVSQTNSVESDATAANANLTGQDADQESDGSGIQAVGQEADSEQDAVAASTAEQAGAKNTNISVRVLSPGDDGSVDQSNSVDSSATAANLNLTKQDADQDQGGSGGIQAIGQEADSDQKAAALSVAKQQGASNTNIPVRVLSDGNNGRVEQSNSVNSSATAANLNALKQDADQDQGDKGDGCGCESGGIQAIGQEAKSDQDAVALSAALQSGASNTNTPVRVGSEGDDGHVSQSNSVDSDATALNVNLTKQDADQDQKDGHDGCGCPDGDGIQAIGQEAKSDQSATAASLAAQSFGHDGCGCPSGGNTNTPVSVDSKGGGGSVDQSNSVDSNATAANLNALKQDADQDGGSGGIQAIGQEAKSDQDAKALSAALQFGASNTNTPVGVDSKGGSGDVDQSNKVDSDATALNVNLTKQDADQDQKDGHEGCGCPDGDGIQAIGQEAKSDQDATAASLAVQAFGHDGCGCPSSAGGNTNTSVGVDNKDGHGRGGNDVDQTNKVDSDATAANLNALKQDADQDGGSGGIQAIGQEAKSDQDAKALSAALQFGASNTNTPVGVDSKGGSGDVDQSNKVDSDATALNVNLTKQDADQDQKDGHEGCGCPDGDGIQAIGQEAKSDQDATAASLAVQAFGHDGCGCPSSAGGNTNTSVGVDNKDGHGRGGNDVDQTNKVDSDATAANLNALKQDADQDGGSGIQAIGQEAKNDQDATALSFALQTGASNTNTPVSVDSKGHAGGGDVDQTNKVDSSATAANLNALKQDADQDGGSGGIQAIGQEAKSDQDAKALSAALQFGASNTNTPVGVDSKGGSGDVDQSNKVDSDATALNVNLTKQDADQDQKDGHEGCGCPDGDGIQAIGQEAKSDQDATAASLAVQAFGHDGCGCPSSAGGNTNTSVGVDNKDGHGRGGNDVDQTNKVDSDATAANLNALKQDADQDGGSGGIQAIGQEAKSDQDAKALSAALQFGASNTNTPVGVDSKGGSGDVDQSNKVDSDATALNVNLTKQDADQDQKDGHEGCGCPDGDGIQAIGQEAKSDQDATAASLAVQAFGHDGCGCPSSAGGNTNTSVGVDNKDGHGRGGNDVDQTNKVDSDATAANLNALKQDADQDGGSGGIQAIGQEAKSDQDAKALSAALQFGASNTNTPVGVDSKGGSGDVDQSNKVDSDATALNVNLTKQDADQDQKDGHDGCGCPDGDGIQAIGQEAKSDQDATAASLAVQAFGHDGCGCPSSAGGNTNTSVGVDNKDGHGRGGNDVDQTNKVDSDATAANLNALKQDADQDGGSGIQAIGQEAKNDQDATALSAALQFGASNTNTPVSVDSKGHAGGGDVDQSNKVDSSATAANLNALKQDADQDGGSGGIQAIGQEAKSDQDAKALSAALQFGASNTNTPVGVDSKGGSGDVDQSNKVDSDATALNVNLTKQDADQDQKDGHEGCGCPDGDGIQAIGQEAKSDQDATAASLAVQAFGHDGCGCPSSAGGNTNTSVGVDNKDGHGRGGNDVDQTNKVDSDATAANLNALKQDADQDGGSGIQAIGQEAKNDQDATALSAALQFGASNTNTPVSVDSKGHAGGGDVDQTNKVDSSATAANLNALKQDADQDGGSGGIQAIGQEAKSDQDAKALSAALQFGASNSNTPVGVDSKGGSGDVDQSNKVDSDATALNVNLTKQDADQDQKDGHDGCGCPDGDGIQAIGQEAKSDQDATAASLAVQAFGHDGCGCPSSAGGNTNTTVGVDNKDGHGRGGNDVDQTNKVDSDATAANLNALKQDADQDGGSGGIQAIGQEAKSDQDAKALSAALQFGASNTNTPVGVDSKGGSGDVDQSNKVDSDATALNVNLTKQDADQDQKDGHDGCGCPDGDGIQAIGQEAKSDQDATAASLAVQAFGHDGCGCPSSAGGNTNTTVGVDNKDGHGRGGNDVDQTNKVDSDATAANLNALKQDADQDGGSGIQAIGQEAKNDQDATALSAALQFGASNTNTPVSVDSKGHAGGGDVDQTNKVDSSATAANLNLTKQDADQDQKDGHDGCGCPDGIGIQAIGQEAKNDQDATAASFALQTGASNTNTPVGVDSKGGHGDDVDQTNSVDSSATAANLNALKQDADQDQGGVAGIGIQAIGQSAKNEQGALALSAALQFGASNSSTPVGVDSKGHGGDVDQTNSVESDATALNLNLTKQDADQDQKGRDGCGCPDGIGIQAIGQESKNEQGALAASLGLQVFGHDRCGCPSGGNSNTPVGVGGHGSSGSVDQSNRVRSSATALNLNALLQDADQDQHGGDGIQAIGQSAKNRQRAIGLSAALQFGARNTRR